MRKIVLALASVAALGLALPVVSAPAEARDVVVIKKNKGHHYGWRNHRAEHVVVVKKRHRHHNHGAAVIVR